jgi:hypothetical protein
VIAVALRTIERRGARHRDVPIGRVRAAGLERIASRIAT